MAFNYILNGKSNGDRTRKISSKAPSSHVYSYNS